MSDPPYFRRVLLIFAVRRILLILIWGPIFLLIFTGGHLLGGTWRDIWELDCLILLISAVKRILLIFTFFAMMELIWPGGGSWGWISDRYCDSSTRASPTSTCFHSASYLLFLKKEISRMMNVVSLSLDHDPAGGKWTESINNVSHMYHSMSFWLNLVLELARWVMSSQKLPYLE